MVMNFQGLVEKGSGVLINPTPLGMVRRGILGEGLTQAKKGTVEFVDSALDHR